ncbi:hypothetical protein D3C80_707980 [compost metagenome]
MNLPDWRIDFAMTRVNGNAKCRTGSRLFAEVGYQRIRVIFHGYGFVHFQRVLDVGGIALRRVGETEFVFLADADDDVIVFFDSDHRLVGYDNLFLFLGLFARARHVDGVVFHFAFLRLFVFLRLQVESLGQGYFLRLLFLLLFL